MSIKKYLTLTRAGIIEALQGDVELGRFFVREHRFDALQLGDAVQDGFGGVPLKLGESLPEKGFHGGFLSTAKAGSRRHQDDGENHRLKNSRCHMLCCF